MSLTEQKGFRPDNRDFAHGLVPITNEEALAIAGSKERLEEIRAGFGLPEGDPKKQTGVLVKTGAKLYYDPDTKQWSLLGYHYKGDDARTVVDAAKAGYKGFLDGEKGEMEIVDGAGLTQAADHAEIFRLASRVGVVIPLFNNTDLQVIEIRPKLRFRIFGNTKKVLEVRQAVNARQAILGSNADAWAQNSIMQMEAYEKKYGKPQYDPNKMNDSTLN